MKWNIIHDIWLNLWLIINLDTVTMLQGMMLGTYSMFLLACDIVGHNYGQGRLWEDSGCKTMFYRAISNYGLISSGMIRW
jgi:hypothetical protein